MHLRCFSNSKFKIISLLLSFVPIFCELLYEDFCGPLIDFSVFTKSVPQQYQYDKNSKKAALAAAHAMNNPAQVIKPRYSHEDLPYFLVLGTNDVFNKGLGNVLSFFPAVYYFAIFTKRTLVIKDEGIIGHFCSVVKCGFPMLSEIAPVYPELFSQHNLNHLRILGAKDFKEIFDGRQYLDPESHLITSFGYDPKSEWWMYFNGTTDCAAKVSGCDRGDITCTERHAFQSLIQGPFLNKETVKEAMSRIAGMPEEKKLGLFTLPRKIAPRFDIAIHLRNQFANFEMGNALNSTDYLDEVHNWLNGTECADIFRVTSNWILDSVKDLRQKIDKQTRAYVLPPLPLYIYIATDNELVKDALKKTLIDHPELSQYPISYVTMESATTHHIKHFKLLQSVTNGTGLTNLVFDWYALSLSNRIYAWRKGSMKGLSTFAFSASKVSGTKARTDVGHGSGVGTQGFQIYRNKNGAFALERFWLYPTF